MLYLVTYNFEGLWNIPLWWWCYVIPMSGDIVYRFAMEYNWNLKTYCFYRLTRLKFGVKGVSLFISVLLKIIDECYGYHLEMLVSHTWWNIRELMYIQLLGVSIWRLLSPLLFILVASYWPYVTALTRTHTP